MLSSFVVTTRRNGCSIKANDIGRLGTTQAAPRDSPGIGNRITAFAAYTSARSVDELDGLEKLDTGEPDIFALVNRRLLDSCDIRTAGGCYGTSPRHMEAVAERILEI
ncbi:MAG: hypothetical protein PVI79_16485 [Gammaproteobacteria bacterium]|jgi:hypothetical protein